MLRLRHSQSHFTRTFYLTQRYSIMIIINYTITTRISLKRQYCVTDKPIISL